MRPTGLFISEDYCSLANGHILRTMTMTRRAVAVGMVRTTHTSDKQADSQQKKKPPVHFGDSTS